MNAVHDKMDKDSVPAINLVKQETVTAGEAGIGQGENDKRATEIGPVLEEILQSHWEHWGLND